jgi:hypothetical protein
VRARSIRHFMAWGLSLLLLAGCAIVPKAKDGEPLKANQGLVVFHVTSNVDSRLSYLDFADASSFGSRFSELMVGPKGSLPIKAGETFYVIPLDAGDYMFSRFDAHPYFLWLQGSNRFQVRPNAITYIGHLRVRVADARLALQAADRELDMRTYLSETYPSYFRSMDFQKAIAELRRRAD